MFEQDYFNNSGTYQMGPLQSAAINQNFSGSEQGLLNTIGSGNGQTGAGFSIPGFNSGNQLGGGFSLGGLLGQNGGNLQLGLGALQTLGGLWNSYNSSKLAKESLGLQKKAFEKNLENNTKTYNTALEDRIRARYATEGRSDEADAYIADKSL